MFWKRCKISTAHFKTATREERPKQALTSHCCAKEFWEETHQLSHPTLQKQACLLAITLDLDMPAGAFFLFFLLTSLIASSCKASGCWRQAFNLCIARAVCGECPFALTSSGNKWLLSLDPGSHVLLAYAMQKKTQKHTQKKCRILNPGTH